MTDKGAKGMNRWVRLPNGINGKAKYLRAGVAYACKLLEWNLEIAYTVEELLDGLAPESTEPQAKPAPLPRSDPSQNNDDTAVYVPRPETNAVISALKTQGLYKRALGNGKHDITCPWLHEHTDGLDTGACYFEPDGTYLVGGFKCQHSHDYHISNLIDFLGLDLQAARHRPLRPTRPAATASRVISSLNNNSRADSDGSMKAMRAIRSAR